MTDPTQEQRGVIDSLREDTITFKYDGLEAVTQACGLLDIIKQEWDGMWTEHDQAVRDGLSRILSTSLYAKETEQPKPVEQGASMGPAEMTDRERAEYWYEAAQQAYRWRDINAESCRIYDDEVKQGVARQKELQAEVSKLSTRIDEIQLAETKAVEELARVREENHGLLQFVKAYRIQHSIDCGCKNEPEFGDERCVICDYADVLLAKAPKPLDANEGGE